MRRKESILLLSRNHNHSDTLGLFGGRSETLGNYPVLLPRALFTYKKALLKE